MLVVPGKRSAYLWPGSTFFTSQTSCYKVKCLGLSNREELFALMLAVQDLRMTPFVGYIKMSPLAFVVLNYKVA